MKAESITEDNRRTFRERGLTRVARLIPNEIVTAAREHIYAGLTQAGLWRNDCWVEPDDRELTHNRLNFLKARAKSNLIKSLSTPQVLECARDLADGEALTSMSPHVQLLFTPPNAPAWRVPHNVWHLDAPRLGDGGLPGVQMFTFLDTVLPGGGGTLLVAGSHRLLNGQGFIRSKQIKRRLKRESYFRDLMDVNLPNRECFLETVGHVGDVPLQVVELTGEPGDVYFTDLRLLHSLGPNASVRPRIMATERLHRAGVMAALREGYQREGFVPHDGA